MFASALLMLFSGPAWAGDKDKDGIKKGDECPKEPEDMDGFQDEDGCPDPDNDGDGILDGDDKCPDKAEDKDGFQDADGCPDEDNDNDGVLDADDQCDGEVENDDTKDGCPTVNYDLLTSDGWSPAVNTLNDQLSAALLKGAEGCPDAVKAGQGWMMKNDPDALHTTFKARLARAPEGFDSKPVTNVLAAHSTFWTSAKAAFDIYCKDDAGWTGLAPKLDDVYKKAAEKPAE